MTRPCNASNNCVALYQQIYPVSEYPNGHRSIVACYVDICRILKTQKNLLRAVEISEEGLHVYRRLILRDEQVRFSAYAASFHSYIGVACFAVDRHKESTRELLSCSGGISFNR